MAEIAERSGEEAALDADEARATLEALRATLGRVIRGKAEAIDLLLTGVLSGGHVLVEDVPGVGKTTLAKALARAFDVRSARIQFTPDLLPADILGSTVLDPGEASFSFQPGPIFANVLLADEINRASPRTQSALLEAMSEGQVSVDGTTHPLPVPFFVIATQNPVDHQGTYPLPEAQLDRFVLRLALGYPEEDDELGMLLDQRQTHPLEAVAPVASGRLWSALERRVRTIEVREPVARYLLRLIAATRGHGELELGVSPRGALALYHAAQARALLDGRDYVLPDDVQALVAPVLSHRIVLAPRARYGGSRPEDVLAAIVESVEVPA